MKVLLAYPHVMQRMPMAMYWIGENGGLHEEVINDTPELALSRVEIASKPDTMDWQDYFTALGDHTPVTVNFDVVDSDDPQALATQARVAIRQGR